MNDPTTDFISACDVRTKADFLAYLDGLIDELRNPEIRGNRTTLGYVHVLAMAIHARQPDLRPGAPMGPHGQWTERSWKHFALILGNARSRD